MLGCPSRRRRPGPKAPLYDNLGNYHFAITTTSPEAQKYFDQGLTLSYAFNHAEAIRAFRQAAALDPELRDVLLGRGVRVRAEHQRADHRGGGQGGVRRRSSRRGSARASASEKERAYIDALAKRYAADPKAERAPLDRAYADAMRDVSRSASRTISTRRRCSRSR